MTDDHHSDLLPEGGGGDRLDVESSPAKSPRGWGQFWEGLVRMGLGEVALRVGTGLASLALILLVVWVMSNLYVKGSSPTSQQESAKAATIPTLTPTIHVDLSQLAELQPYTGGISRQADLHTILPTRPRFEIITYEVQPGDTLFTIAEKYNLRPQTMMWGNYLTLRDNPDTLRVGQKLNILPVNGVLYQWNAGDRLNKVAQYFSVKPEDIINFPGNNLDANTIGDYDKPNITVGATLVVPGGKREFSGWSAPVVTRKNPAAAKVLGPGNCGIINAGPVGNGTFVWPTKTKFISNPFSLEINHPAIDLPGYIGSPIAATDAGVVVYSGWNDWGFGNLIMIDHGNGWQSLYAHLSQINLACGAPVQQGQVIGLMGSTGNSTGPHLHFELRNDAYGKVNPLLFLR
jgi:murein DD-endopeptidase MepM/ murein hydrolase activator NlpD